jgi:magnesium transporter
VTPPGPAPTGRIPVPLSAYIVDCAVYVDGKRLAGRWAHGAAIAEVRRRRDGFVWLGLHEPDAEQIQAIAELLGLHELAVEDAVNAHQRPKVERYDDVLFTVLKTIHYVEHESPTTASSIVEAGEIMVFLGRDFVVTVRHGEHSGLRQLRAELEAAPERLRAGPAAVLYAITDQVVDSYLAVSSALQNDVDLLDALVFAPRSQLGAEQMYLMKRAILELRRAVVPLVAPLRRLVEGYSPLLPQPIRSYFRDVDDHLTTAAEQIATYDDLLDTLLDATIAKLSLQQSNDMRKITSWAAIIAVPTLVAGVYGMNFSFMPELHWAFGYPVVLATTLLVCVVLHRIFTRNRWL